MTTKSSDKKVKRTYQIESYQDKALKMLSEKTRIKQVAFVREAIDDLILKHQQRLPKYLIRNVHSEVQ